MKNISDSIRKWVEHPVTNLIVGVILFTSGFVETYQSFDEDYSRLRIGAHHGIMLFGLLNVIASIPDLIEGISTGATYLEHMEEKRKKVPRE